MNRRQFVGSTLAALVPSWLVVPVKRRTLDLSAFCSDWESRKHDMRFPFRQGEWTFATDGRVCVRVRPESGDSDRDALKLPPADALPWWDHDSLTGWKRARPEIIVARDFCPDCEMDAEGWRLIKNCGKCYHQSIATPNLVRIDGVYFDRALWERFAPLNPEVSYKSSPTSKQCLTAPLRLRFDGGIGLLVPLESKAAIENIERGRDVAAHIGVTEYRRINA